MKEKTYNKRNLKFLFLLVLILIFSVILLLYLLSLKDFLPFGTDRSYNWTNILTFLSFLSSIIFSLVSILLYIFLTVFLKKEDGRELKIVCIKWSIFFTLGLLLVLFLNFFHILSIYWGLGIFLVVIIASFVI